MTQRTRRVQPRRPGTAVDPDQLDAGQPVDEGRQQRPSPAPTSTTTVRAGRHQPGDGAGDERPGADPGRKWSPGLLGRPEAPAPYAASTHASCHGRQGPVVRGAETGGTVRREWETMGPMLPTTAALDDERAERTVPPRPVEEVDEAPLPRLDGPTLPRRLASEPPGWVREVDVVVVGSGIAGLTAALECRERMGPDSLVMVVTKDVVAAGSTRWAQGGIASVQAEGDTVEQHVEDTLVAGAGLCEPSRRATSSSARARTRSRR